MQLEPSAHVGISVQSEPALLDILERFPARYRFIRRLGEGGFGEVFHVHDQELGIPVALKCLKFDRPKLRLHFRKEFRAIQRISHPNITKLYEFEGRQHYIFYTMELVEGVPFDAYIRNEDLDHHAFSQAPESSFFIPNRTLSEIQPAQPTPKSTRNNRATPLPAPPFDEARLRATLGQLLAGLQRLHEHDIYHRDLKPSNVFVTDEGQVKILDFGLVAELTPENALEEFQRAGTPAYMPPEGEQPGEAGDLYSIGVMLYQALTGLLPFAGSAKELQHQKTEMPPPPSHWVNGLPKDLEDLCLDLLHPNPHKRLESKQRFAQLGVAAMPSKDSHLFVGRQQEMQQLEEALQHVKQGTPHILSIQGLSGAGKSALVSRFFRTLRTLERDQLAVFSVHCYEQESVPFRAIGGFIDLLCHFLNRLSPLERNGILPPQMADLLRLFPVLGHVKGIRNAPPAPNTIHAQERRRRAFASLRELLRRLTQTKHLILFLDDLQWLDQESALLLDALLCPPEPLCLLLLLSYRREDASENPHLQNFLTRLRSYAPQMPHHHIDLEALDQPESQLLVAQLTAQHTLQETQIQGVLRDAQGSPLLLKAFAQHLKRQHASPNPPPKAAYALETVFQELIDKLHPSSRQLLQLLSVSHRPLPQPLLKRLIQQKDWVRELPELRVNSLLRIRRFGEIRSFDLYHSQIKTYLLNNMDTEKKKQLHLTLAESIDGQEESDLERKAFHYHHGGKTKEAQEHLLQAAQNAFQALAFSHAARLYALALQWQPASTQEERALLLRLAESNGNMGRGREAAETYLKAAALATADQALELKQKAATQYLIGGNIDQGLELLQELFEQLGLFFPESASSAIPHILYHRAILWLRGIELRKAQTKQLTPQQRAVLDSCYIMSLVFGQIDPVRASYFQALFIRQAIKYQEQVHYIHALMLQGAHYSIGAESQQTRCNAIIEQAINLAKHQGHNRALLTAEAILGFIAFVRGRWKDAYHHFGLCASHLQREDIYLWEKSTVHIYQMNALLFQGQFNQIQKALPKILEDARQRGDAFTKTYLSWGVKTKLHLALDQPELARQTADETAQGWTHSNFGVQRYVEMLARTEIFLYTKEPERALHQLESCHQKLHQLRLKHSLFHRLELNNVHARIYLAQALRLPPNDPTRKSLLTKVLRAAKALDGLLRWGSAFGHLLRAGVASLTGDKASAITHLIAAETKFESFDMMQHAHAARLCWGRLADNEALEQEGAKGLASLGIVNIESTLHMLLPGSWLQPQSR